MGYSVSVKFKNENERERMKNFLLENKEILEKMSQLDKMGFSLPFNNEPSNGEDLGYAPKKSFLLGFHGVGIPRHIWDLCSWMSVKANAKKGNDNYFYYDDEKMIVTQDLNNKMNTIVDDRGIRIVNEDRDFSFLDKAVDLITQKKKMMKEQHKLFVSLDQKWNEYTLTKEDTNNTNKTRKPK